MLFPAEFSYSENESVSLSRDTLNRRASSSGQMRISTTLEIKQDQFHFRIHAITFARITIIPKIAAFAFLGDIHGNLVTHPEQRVVIFIFGMLGLPDHRPSCLNGLKIPRP